MERRLVVVLIALAACKADAPRPPPWSALLGDPRWLTPEILRIDPAPLSLRTRIVLQNDAWGALQRLSVSSTTAEVAAELKRLIWTMAPSPELLTAMNADAAPIPFLPPALALRERSSELSILSHERAFGLRRVFRLFIGGDHRMMVSQLVAFDREGHPHLTDVIGEIEQLAFEGDHVKSARVVHLERTHPEQPVEVETIDQIPGEGANKPIARFDKPTRVADLPCAECHHDAGMMSLPIDTESPATRIQRLLARVESERP